MKKFLAFVLAMLLVFPALADQLDYSNMSGDELHDVMNSVRNELVKRELLNDEKVLLFQQDGVSVYLTGEFDITWNNEIEIKAITINDSNSKLSIHPEDLTISVNGWDVRATCDLEAKPGQKKKGSLSFSPEDAEIKTADEIQEIIFYFAMKLDDGKWQHIGPCSVQLNH